MYCIFFPTNTVTLNGQVGSNGNTIHQFEYYRRNECGMAAGFIYTSGNQTYSGTVTLNGDGNLIGANLAFNGATTSIDGVSGQNLLINTTGTSNVANAISGNIANLTLNSASGYSGRLLLSAANNYTGTTSRCRHTYCWQ